MIRDVPARSWFLWLAVLAGATVGLVALRPELDKVHVAFAYLLVVLIGSARGGLPIGLALSVAGFLSFNFFFLQPYYTLTVTDKRDWFVLAAFLATSAVAAQLLARARSEASAAASRASEVERLSSIGAETLNAGRAQDALGAIADVIRQTLHAASCDIYVGGETGGPVVHAASDDGANTTRTSRAFGQPSEDRLVEWVAEHGRAAVELRNGSIRFASGDGHAEIRGENGSGNLMPSGDALALLLPLTVRGRTVGVLRVAPEAGQRLHSSQQRFLEALSYYAALGIERRRLVAEAEHADALRKAGELKNALLASVSHDLRTPLTTIKALAHDLAATGDDRAITIEEEADRLNRFVADLLDLSRLAGGALTVTPEINAAEDLVGAAVQRVGGAARHHDLVASLDTSEPLLLGRFDFVHSLRVLVNLIENALKYSPVGSTIELRAARAGPWLDFSVADRGPGIPAEEQGRIFEAFYRPAAAAPNVEGVGLGLSIARGLAEAQGGTLRYEARDGGGSRFVLRLPAADVSELDTVPEPSL